MFLLRPSCCRAVGAAGPCVGSHGLVDVQPGWAAAAHGQPTTGTPASAAQAALPSLCGAE